MSFMPFIEPEYAAGAPVKFENYEYPVRKCEPGLSVLGKIALVLVLLAALNLGWIAIRLLTMQGAASAGAAGGVTTNAGFLGFLGPTTSPLLLWFYILAGLGAIWLIFEMLTRKTCW